MPYRGGRWTVRVLSAREEGGEQRGWIPNNCSFSTLTKARGEQGVLLHYHSSYPRQDTHTGPEAARGSSAAAVVDTQRRRNSKVQVFRCANGTKLGSEVSGSGIVRKWATRYVLE